MPWARGDGSDDSTSVDGDRAGLDLGPEVDQPLGVERLVQAVVDRLADQHVVGHRHRARRPAFSWQAARAGQHGGQEVLGLHALEVDGPPLAAARCGARTRARLRFHRQRAASIGWGSTAWVSTSAPCALLQHGRHLGQREAVLGPERQHDGVVVRRRLQLEVERDAEPLAQGQSEGPVDAAAERGVDDELGALALVEDSARRRALPGREVRRARPARRPGRPRPGRPPRPTRRPGSAPARRAPSPSPRGQQRLELGPQVARPPRRARPSGPGPRPARRGWSAAGRRRRCTRTVPISTLATRHECVPRRKMSPAVASTAKSSCTEPTVTPSGSSTTR